MPQPVRIQQAAKRYRAVATPSWLGLHGSAFQEREERGVELQDLRCVVGGDGAAAPAVAAGACRRGAAGVLCRARVPGVAWRGRSTPAARWSGVALASLRQPR